MKEEIKKIIEEFKIVNQQESEILEELNRGYLYAATDNPKGEILVVGVNPSYKKMTVKSCRS